MKQLEVTSAYGMNDLKEDIKILPLGLFVKDTPMVVC